MLDRSPIHLHFHMIDWISVLSIVIYFEKWTRRIFWYKIFCPILRKSCLVYYSSTIPYTYQINIINRVYTKNYTYQLKCSAIQWLPRNISLLLLLIERPFTILIIKTNDVKLRFILSWLKIQSLFAELLTIWVIFSRRKAIKEVLHLKFLWFLLEETQLVLQFKDGLY